MLVHLCSEQYHAYSHVIHNSQKVEAINLSIDGRMDKQNALSLSHKCMYTHARILFSLNNEAIPKHVTTQMNLRNIMRSQRSQPQEVKYCMIPLM